MKAEGKERKGKRKGKERKGKRKGKEERKGKERVTYTDCGRV